MTITRTLSVAAVAGCLTASAPLSAQIIRVPSPSDTHRAVAASASFGFLQTQSRFDGQSGAQWHLSEAMQYRASIDLGMRSGALGVAAALATVPIRRSLGTAPAYSSGTIQLRQFFGTFRTPEREGAHQIIEVGLGLSQWAGYSGTDVLTADEAKARNAFTLAVGYGFGFTLGDRAALMVVQDLVTLWGSNEGLPAGSTRAVRQYTTRVGLRYRMRGER